MPARRRPLGGSTRTSSTGSTPSSPASRPPRRMAGKVPVAFLAGFISVLTPCVLPLLPGYLSAVSAVEAGRLGERGTARRVALSSVPFIIGFTTVFVLVGAGAAAVGGVLDSDTRTAIAGFVLVVMGLA